MIYFDNAATTFPKPHPVAAEVERCIRSYCGNPGRSSHKLSLAAAEKIFETRRRIASLFGSDSPENVIFTLNTTYALNIALKAFITPHCHIIISGIDHNSIYRQAYSLAESDEISCTITDIPSLTLERESFENAYTEIVRAAIRPDTRIIAISHVSNLIPLRLPIDKIGALCAQHGIKFIVDAAQSAGIYDIDIVKMNIDALCAPGHKALYGPQGCGFAAFNPKYRDASEMRTFIEGGSGVNSLEPTMPDFLPERFEAGTLPTPAIAGLCEGVKFVAAVTTSAIRAQTGNIYRRAREYLSNMQDVTLYAPQFDEGESLLFNVNGITPAETARRFDDSGICTRSGLHCSPLAHKMLGTGDNGAVRISFSYFNTVREVDTMAALMMKWKK